MAQHKYADYFYRFINPINLDQREIEEINNFVKDLVDIKMTQTKFKNDNRKIVENSFNNGYISEVALEHFLKIKFIKWNIREESEKDFPDLSYLGINVGIKTCNSDKGHFPLIYSRPKNPEIITILKPPNTVFICGYATIPVLKYYQSPEYAFGTAYNKKGGFWGFHKLHNFKNKKELRGLVENTNLDYNISFTETTKSFINDNNSEVTI